MMRSFSMLSELHSLEQNRLSSRVMINLTSGRLRFSDLSGFLKKIPFEAWFGKATPFFYLCAVVMVASLILGGGSRRGLGFDAALQLVAIPLFLFSLWRMFEVLLTRQMRAALWF